MYLLPLLPSRNCAVDDSRDASAMRERLKVHCNPSVARGTMPELPPVDRRITVDSIAHCIENLQEWYTSYTVHPGFIFSYVGW